MRPKDICEAPRKIEPRRDYDKGDRTQRKGL